MSDTQNEPLPGEKAIKVKKAGPILLGADRYDIFEKGQKAIREFAEELFRFLIDWQWGVYTQSRVGFISNFVKFI